MSRTIGTALNEIASRRAQNRPALDYCCTHFLVFCCAHPFSLGLALLFPPLQNLDLAYPGVWGLCDPVDAKVYRTHVGLHPMHPHRYQPQNAQPEVDTTLTVDERNELAPGDFWSKDVRNKLDAL